jgi:O-antigen ligase
LKDAIFRRPLLGYGFSAFWQGLQGESGRVIRALGWTLGYAHNGLIEVLLQVGMVGGIIFLCTFVKAMKDAWFCFRHDKLGKYDWYVALLVLTLVYNLDEETFFFANDLLSVIYIVMCCGLALAVKQLKQDNRRGALIGEDKRISFAS